MQYISHIYETYTCIQVVWADERDPSKGFKHIYLTETDYTNLLHKAGGKIELLPVRCSPQTLPGGEVRYIITDIIGEEPDLGTFIHIHIYYND